MLIELLCKAAIEIGHIAKERRPSGGPQFQYRGIDDVLGAVGPVFARLGISCTPHSVEVLERAEVKVRNGTEIRTLLLCQFTLAAGDEEVSISSLGEAMDSRDKGVTKAMSVALRQALLYSLLLPVDEPEQDPEFHATPKLPSNPTPPPLPSSMAPAETSKLTGVEVLAKFKAKVAALGSWIDLVALWDVTKAQFHPERHGLSWSDLEVPIFSMAINVAKDNEQLNWIVEQMGDSAPSPTIIKALEDQKMMIKDRERRTEAGEIG